MGPTLPEGEEDDCLDGDELEDRLKRAQQVHGGKVEEEEGVKCQADREVVDDGDVEVATLDTAGRERELLPWAAGSEASATGGKEGRNGGGEVHGFATGESTALEGKERQGERGEQGATQLFLCWCDLFYYGSQEFFVPFLFRGSESPFPGTLCSLCSHYPWSSSLGQGAGRTPCPL